MSRFDATSTADEVLDGFDLDGQRVVVTGASGGLGLETARAMAARGAAVTLAARSADKLDAAAADIRAAQPDAEIDTLVVDLADLASVRTATDELAGRLDGIDVLINNAGVMACPLGRTTDGFETQFGTNHLGHFAWSMRLAPSLSDGARMVTLSSAAHRRDTVHLDDPNYESRDYEKWTAYGQSKTANIWFASEAQRRLAERNVLSLSVHPGGIRTDLGRHLSKADVEAFRTEPRMQKITFKSVPEGAATTCWAATAEEPTDHGGAFLEDCQVAVAAVGDPAEAPSGYAPWAYDPQGAGRLWELSEELTGERLDAAGR